MSVDIQTSDHGWFAGVQASLSEDLAVQTARLKELTEISADTGDPGEAHNRAALALATRQNLEEITAALRRIAEGSYGRCKACDVTIPVERLKAVPRAQFCVPCQQKING
jgi:DnaK suppressor protein